MTAKTSKPLAQILNEVEKTDHRPDEIEGGIPKQWLPGWIRWTIRILLLPWILLDLSMQKIATKMIRPPHKKIGTCLKRGNCCHYLLIPHTKNVAGKIWMFIHTQIFGFYPRYKEVQEFEGKKIVVMGCRYLKSDGRCSHYHFRPTVCRKWPMIEYFGTPRIIKGCGFQAVSRKHKAPQ